MSNYTGSSYQSQPNSSMAIVSLITGILGLSIVPVLGSIVAVITGYMARTEIRNSGGALGGDGMATAGLVLGWIGVGLTVIGCCVGAAVFLVPACLIPFGLGGTEFNSVLPLFIQLA